MVYSTFSWDLKQTEPFFLLRAYSTLTSLWTGIATFTTLPAAAA